MPPLKPKPLVAPRTSMAASTPPPLLNTQQASLGCISPSLPPSASHPLKTVRDFSPSSSSSSANNHASAERIQMEADCMGDAHTPMDMDERHIKQENGKLEETTRKEGNISKRLVLLPNLWPGLCLFWCTEGTYAISFGHPTPPMQYLWLCCSRQGNTNPSFENTQWWASLCLPALSLPIYCQGELWATPSQKAHEKQSQGDWEKH